jgi:hypothetical protein
MPTISDSKASMGQTTQLGSFTVTTTGLQASTTYYLRAYAVNSMGTAYGTVIEATTSDAPPVVTSGLVAYYTFDGENCSEAQGKSEYNGVKQGTGTPVWSTDIPGKDGKSLQLSNDAYFNMPTSPLTGTSQYSYCVWIKTMTNCSIFRYNTSSSGYMPAASINNNKITAYYSWGYDYFDLDISNLLIDGSWHLLTVTRNAGTHKLYIDGIYYASRSYTSTNTTNYPLQLGYTFTGKMDNFRAYNRELTQAEITEIYNAKQ